MKKPNSDVEALQVFTETVGAPVDVDTAEIVDPTPLQCFVEEPEDRSDEDDSRERDG